jgi:hypothetical protein
MIEFYYNCSISEAYKYSSFEVSYGFQLANLADRLLPLTGGPALVVKRLTKLASVRGVARELFTLSKQRMAARYYKPTPTFVVGDFASFPLKVTYSFTKVQTLERSTSWSVSSY